MLLSNWVFIGNAQSIKPTIPVVKNGVIDLRNIPLDQASVPHFRRLGYLLESIIISCR
jgi:hypothetical protein